MHVKQHKYRTALINRLGRIFRRKIDSVYLNCIRKSCLRRTCLSLRTHARWVSMSQRRRDHLSCLIRHGINPEMIENSVLLLTLQILTWSVQHGHLIEVTIRRTWIVNTWTTSKVWVLLRELIPTWFLSRSPQRKCRNACNNDRRRSRMSVFQIIFNSLWACE